MSKWIDIRDRQPGPEDGNYAHCILVWRENTGHRIMHWGDAPRDCMVRYWMRLPERPEKEEVHDEQR